MSLSAVRTPASTPVGEPFTETIPLKVWAASTVYRAGDIIRESAESGNYYQCITGGTSNSTAPTWLTTGANVTDNSVTWSYISAGYGGDLVARNGLAAYVVGLQGLPNQNTVTVSYVGRIDVSKASGTTFTDGAAVFFNKATGLAVTTAPTYGFYLGTSMGYWGSGVTTVRTFLNPAYSLLNATTLTFTGAGTLTMPASNATALTVTDGSVTQLVFDSNTPQILAYQTLVAANATTPIIKTATGTSNTGYILVQGKTSGGIKLTCADAAGYTLTLSGAAIATANRTLTFPDPGGSDSVAYLGLAQAVTGAKTFSNAKVVVTQVTAVGSVASLATNSLAAGLNVIAGGGTNLGVMLPTAAAGTVVEVVNASGSTALIYADGIGGTYAVCINALATSTGYSLATTKTTRLICENSTRWWTLPLAVA